jgi:hypothetical protein
MCGVLDGLRHSRCICRRKRRRNKVVSSTTSSDEFCHRKCEPCRGEQRVRDIVGKSPRMVEFRAGGERAGGLAGCVAADIGVGHRVVVSELPTK